MLADMLDAPISELAMSDDIDAGKDFIDAWTLRKLATSLFIENT